MKAISPMIATILLIAFTIGVGGLVSIFVTGLTTTSTGLASNQSEALSKCAGAWINVYSVQGSNVLYSNPNTQTIISVVLIGSDGKATTGDTSMTPGESSVTAWVASTNTSVIARGLCQNLVTVEGKCANTDQCWDV